jgi:Flp pilus assembly pilin Flp
MYTWLASLQAQAGRDERGQGTIEYVLVMLAVAAVAVVLISWAKSGEGKGLLGGLFGDVIGWIVGAAKKFRV